MGLVLPEEPRRIPPASTAPSVMYRFAGFLTVDTKLRLPTARYHYRPLSKIPPADRPPGNEPFCSSIFIHTYAAVDAVGILDSFPGGLSSLSLCILLPEQQ
jgi:hypothetical protein